MTTATSRISRREFIHRSLLTTAGVTFGGALGGLKDVSAAEDNKGQKVPLKLTLDGHIPISLIIDDPSPGLNPMSVHHPESNTDPFIPNKLIHDLADLFCEFGAKGKFSVVPMGFGRGRIDKCLDGVSAKNVTEFIEVVKTRVVPLFDITPEILTHAKAYDLKNGNFLDEREDKYFSHISRETMTDYIVLSLEILKNVGLDANGVTSPWSLGKEKEDDYSWAILDAEKRVHGRRRTWYFLHSDSKCEIVPHRVMHRTASDEWVVSIFSGGFDFAWQTQEGKPGQEDAMISADGRSGRLVELFNHGSSITTHTHWQSLYSNGSYAGLVSLRHVFERVKQHLSDRVIWTKCSRLAELVAEKSV